MSDLRFREIDLNLEPEVARAFVSLVESELGGIRQLSAIKRSIDYEAGNAKILGAFLSGELVSVNAFMRMKFSAGDDSYVGYQSGFSATSKAHRGKGIWPRLLLFSESYLSDLGASFIFGFPNQISHPVFVQKLGYRSTELYDFRVICLPVFDRVGYAKHISGGHVTHSKTILEPDAEYNFSWKRRALIGSKVVSFACGDSIVWGAVRKNVKYHVSIKYLEVGGLSLRSTSELPGISQSCRQSL